MKENELKVIDEAVGKAIELHVNGKIRAVHKMLEGQNDKMEATHQQLVNHLENERTFQAEIRAHMDEVRPFLQGAKGIKIVRDFFIWVGGIFVVYVAFRNSIKF